MSNDTPHNPSGALIDLTSKERARILHNILVHVDKNPFPAQPRLVRSPFYNRATAAALFTLMLVVITTGAAYAAEEALPGDLLYPIKVNINEKVVGALQGNAIAKAEWESERAERRFEEAEILASKGLLNPETRQEIQNHIEENLQSFSIFTNLLAKEGTTNTEELQSAHARFEAKIDAHSKILERIQDYTAEPQQIEVKHLELGVRKKAVEIQEAKPRLAEKNIEKKYEAKKEEVVTLMQQTREAFQLQKHEPKEGLEQHVFDDGSRSLEIARRALIYAEIDNIGGNAENAYSSLIDSERATEEALTQLNQTQKIKMQTNLSLQSINSDTILGR